MYRAFVNAQGGVGVEGVPTGYEAQPGEVLFADPPSTVELDAAFPGAALAAAQAARCVEVDAIRAAKFGAGMAHGGKQLQLREQDQQRIIAAGAQAKFAMLAGAAWPPEFGWIMADNTVLPLDATGMSAMADAAAAQVQAWIFVGHAHKQAIRALNDPAAIAAYDILAGW